MSRPRKVGRASRKDWGDMDEEEEAGVRDARERGEKEDGAWKHTISELTAQQMPWMRRLQVSRDRERC